MEKSYKEKYLKYKNKYLLSCKLNKIAEAVQKVKFITQRSGWNTCYFKNEKDWENQNDGNNYNLPNKYQVRNHINTIATGLKLQNWIKVGDRPFEIDKMYDKFILKPGLKPAALYMSKGDWLFHPIVCLKDKFIDIIQVDYSNIIVITSMEEMDKFIEKYEIIKHFGDDEEREEYVSKYVYNQENNILKLPLKYHFIDWEKVSRKYSGIALVPELFHTYKGWEQKNKWYANIDVSTLAIWNKSAILGYTTMKVNDYIHDDVVDFGWLITDILEDQDKIKMIN